jgi:hypothetical protein
MLNGEIGHKVTCRVYEEQASIIADCNTVIALLLFLCRIGLADNIPPWLVPIGRIEIKIEAQSIIAKANSESLVHANFKSARITKLHNSRQLKIIYKLFEKSFAESNYLCYSSAPVAKRTKTRSDESSLTLVKTICFNHLMY